MCEHGLVPHSSTMFHTRKSSIFLPCCLGRQVATARGHSCRQLLGAGKRVMTTWRTESSPISRTSRVSLIIHLETSWTELLVIAHKAWHSSWQSPESTLASQCQRMSKDQDWWSSNNPSSWQKTRRGVNVDQIWDCCCLRQVAVGVSINAFLRSIHKQNIESNGMNYRDTKNFCWTFMSLNISTDWSGWAGRL